MSTFYRFAGLAVVLISFGLLVSALPSPRAEDAAWVITGTDPMSLIFANFFIEVKTCISAIAGCQDLVTLKANIAIFVALCNKCAADLLKIGTVVKLTADAQASIVACFVALFTLLVKVLLNLTVKFGLPVIISLCVEVDACLHLLLKNLDVCFHGIVALIVKACAGSVVDAFFKLGFESCLPLFGL
ncbi:hypothetical protein B0J17DRAFT_631968 [Rhizoctonia solani]|nr:hypothetical protein B0J17DRAFT_631968 [Rhizoctonia solani]